MKRIGIIGGGQLGRMLAYEAFRMGFTVAVLDPDRDAPAMQVCHYPVVASYDEESAYRELIKHCDVLTYEFENISSGILQNIKEILPVRPNPDILEIKKNRRKEKELVRSYGIPVPEIFPQHEISASTTSLEQLYYELRATGKDWVLKSASFGYDGKYQIHFSFRDTELEEFLQKLQNIFRELRKDTLEVLIEEKISFDFEFSIIFAGFEDENKQYKILRYEPFLNHHKEGILRKTFAYPNPPVENLDEIETKFFRLMKDFHHIGLLTVEFFYKDGKIYFNELAPRPHNSGHLTIEACNYSQFQTHLRAITGLPLHKPELLMNAGMLNLISFHELDNNPHLLQEILKFPQTYFHYYGKKEARERRKMGHITVIDKDFDTVKTRIAKLETLLYKE